VLATVGQSYRLAWRHYPQFLGIAWSWLVLLAPVLFLLVRLQFPANATLCTDATLDRIQNDSVSAYSLVITLLLGCTGSSIAVAWHRLIQRAEPAEGQVYMRIDALVLQYFLAAAGLIILSLLPDMLDAWMQAQSDYADSFTEEIAVGALMILVSPFVARLPVLLPARALGVAMGFGDAWQRTRRNFTRLAWVQTLCLVPFFLLCFPFSLLFTAAGCKHPQLSALAYTVSQLFYLLIAAPVYLCSLSLSYRFFFEKDAPPVQVTAS
jgi:hypothetical protein